MDKEPTEVAPISQITLQTPMPPTANHAWLVRGKMKFRTKKYRDFEKIVGKIIDGRLLEKGRYKVTLVLFPDTRRKADADNRTKCLLDAITDSGFWEDDSLVNEIHIRKGEVIEDEACAFVGIDLLPRDKWYVPAKVFGLVKKVFKKSKKKENDDEYWDDECW